MLFVFYDSIILYDFMLCYGMLCYGLWLYNVVYLYILYDLNYDLFHGLEKLPQVKRWRSSSGWHALDVAPCSNGLVTAGVPQSTRRHLGRDL